MAPEICRDVLTRLPGCSRVIDPMCGSGTVLRHAVELGHDAVGIDMDPLAILLSRAWTTAIPAHRLIHDAAEIADRAASLGVAEVCPPWRQEETQQFAEFWFADAQRDQLMRLSVALRRSRLRSVPFLWVCLSRLIITKDRGASLARDVSHSRPHRVSIANDFDVYQEFVRAARVVATRLDPGSIRGRSSVMLGDARDVSPLSLGRFSAAITSPPYLNAIDYLRGHRLALIWFGHEISALRDVRSNEIGAERGAIDAPFDVSAFIRSEGDLPLPSRYVGWVDRYAADMLATAHGLAALVEPGGLVVVVVANSLLRGASIDNAQIVIECGTSAGLELMDRRERTIPARRRYLPLPAHGTALAKRMREETVLTFEVPRSSRSRRRGRPTGGG